MVSSSLHLIDEPVRGPDLVEAIPHPLLESGLRLVLAGERDLPLDRALDAHVSELLNIYRAELELVRQAVLSIARHESAEVFAARVGLGSGD